MCSQLAAEGRSAIFQIDWLIDLFHPLRYMCSIGHVGYSWQFTYYKTFMKYIYIHPINEIKYTYKNNTATNLGLMSVTKFKNFILVVFGCILSYHIYT
jgi:hypothetical protein